MDAERSANRLAAAVHAQGRWLGDLDTPSLVVNLDQLVTNVSAMASAVAARGVALRPHFKTHKTLQLADLQRRHGANGQTCATLGEAEVLADGGFDDIFVAYPVWPGGRKRARLQRLHERVHLTVGLDSSEAAEALGSATRGGSNALRVLVEIDSGGRRTGVAPAEAVEVAVAAAKHGLEIVGVFTHGGHSYGLGDAARRAAREEVNALEAAVARLQADGFDSPIVSSGSTPTALLSASGPVTEERPGTYVFGDRQQAAIGSCALDEVALVVVATVVSRAVEGQIVLDAGTKILGRETQPWLTGYGLLPSWPSIVLDRLYDHHGVGRLPSGAPGPSIGSVAAVIPNHVCPVVNLARELVMVRGDAIVDRWQVAAQSAV